MNNKVFNYYKKKYKLNIKLKYSYAYGALGVYNTKTKIIKIDKKQIERMTKEDYYGVYELGLFLNDKRQIFNFTLLHELKHAIDLKNKKHYLLSQTKLLDLKANRWAFKRYKGIK
jgi:hypothetical protein